MQMFTMNRSNAEDRESAIACNAASTGFAAAYSARARSEEVVGESPEMQVVKRLIDRVSSGDVPVLITGETGTGKELLARRVHDMSPRSGYSFQAINCAAIPDSLLEAELFGFEKGAFTGATFNRPGKITLAHKGTLFLDEIGDLSLAAQAKVLRALEQKEVQPVGSRSTLLVDFRLVAATNRDLAKMVREKTFRSDLLFRLNTIEVYVPPLRDRRLDIVPLAYHFLRSSQAPRPYSLPVHLTPAAEQFLSQQLWLGNARELRNLMERIILLSDSSEIKLDDVTRLSGSPMSLLRSSQQKPPTLTAFSESGPREESASVPSLRELLTSSPSDLDRLRHALEVTNWNKSRAAELLCCSRMTIHRKLNRYQLLPTVESAQRR